MLSFVILNANLSFIENTVDPDQLASEIHSVFLSDRKYMLRTGMLQVHMIELGYMKLFSNAKVN